MAGWGGGLVRRARAHVGATLPAPCHRCGRIVQRWERWEVDHIIGRDERPDLTADPGNWAPAHRACNRRAGQAVTTAKRTTRGIRPAWVASRPW